MDKLLLRGELESIDVSDIDTGERIPEPTPGDVLLHEFMAPLGLSAYALGRAIGVTANHLTAIIHGTRAITADTAIRLGRHFDTSAEFWMNLQTAHDLRCAREAMSAA